MVGRRRRPFLNGLACAGVVLALQSCLQLDETGSRTFTASAVTRHVPEQPERSQVPPLAGCTRVPLTACRDPVLPRMALRSMMTYVGAGIIAAMVQATLSEVEVLVKNSHDVSLKVVLLSFRATLIANLLKFPFFEALFATATSRATSPLVGGMIAGGIFATVTLPISNFLYRRSMKLPVRWGKLYEAYLPTLLRDVAYGVLRGYAMPSVLGLSGSSITPAVVFLVVFLACLGSSPFNQWRIFLLQHHSEKQPLQDYFRPANYTGIAISALRQGISVGLGYLCAPAIMSFLASRGK